MSDLAKCFHWDQNTPILCAAVAMVRGNLVYMAQRDTPDSLEGKWELVAGKVEFGEHPSDTAFRELVEECEVRGVRNQFILLPTILSNVYPTPHRHYVLVPYGLKWNEFYGHPTTKQGIHRDGRWVTVEEISQLDAMPGCARIADEAIKAVERCGDRKANTTL